MQRDLRDLWHLFPNVASTESVFNADNIDFFVFGVKLYTTRYICSLVDWVSATLKNFSGFTLMKFPTSVIHLIVIQSPGPNFRLWVQSPVIRSCFGILWIFSVLCISSLMVNFPNLIKVRFKEFNNGTFLSQARQRWD